MNQRNKILIVFLILLISFLGWFHYTKIERQAIKEIKINLKDPNSIQTRNIKIYKKRSSEAVCGEFNAKNAMGGYVGYKGFVYMRILNEYGLRTESDNPSENESYLMWKDMVCK